jgi:glutaredoxin 3
MAAARGTLAELVKAHQVVVVQKSWCGFCRRALALIGSHKPSDMVVLDAEAEPTWQQQAIEMTGQRTVPHVFINQTFIGGCDATTAFFENGGTI